jgi:Fic family protein
MAGVFSIFACMSSSWDHIEKLEAEYNATAATVLNVAQFNLYAITHHSTRIEGSTLTQEETNVLLEKGTSIGGKPIEHQNMVLDHYEALLYVLEHARKKSPVTVNLIQQIGSRVMSRTGKEVNSMLGQSDERKGDLRKVNVSAGGHYFVDSAKVPALIAKLVTTVNDKLIHVKTTEDIHSLAFVAHYDLVTIHPFSDGNGRTSRLLMNYIQAYRGKPLTVVDSNERVNYIEALKATREQRDTSKIINFLTAQHIRGLTAEIEAFKKSQKQGDKFKNSDDGYSLIF